MKDNPIIPKVWITKYALTQGVYTLDNVKHCVEIDEKMISFRDAMGPSQSFHGKDWHRTEAAAIERAQDMREDKIKSLEKQISKLKQMEFTVKSDG